MGTLSINTRHYDPLNPRDLTKSLTTVLITEEHYVIQEADSVVVGECYTAVQVAAKERNILGDMMRERIAVVGLHYMAVVRRTAEVCCNIAG